jgi:predicted enzyme related to lactoylglutathione lyase
VHLLGTELAYSPALRLAVAAPTRHDSDLPSLPTLLRSSHIPDRSHGKQAVGARYAAEVPSGEVGEHPNGLNVGLNGREPQGAQAGGGPVITFQPEAGLEAAVDDLKSKGIEFPAEISEHEWGRVATFKDSEGNDLQLYKPPGS